MKKRINTLFILGFWVLCLSPYYGFNLSGQVGMEKRELTVLTWKGDFSKNIEAWLNDRIGPKELATELYSRFHYLLMLNNDLVLKGKDHWLFYCDKDDGDVFGDWLGRNPLSTEELEKIVSNLIRSQKKMEQKRIKFLLVIAPNKERIYREFLPDNFSEFGNNTRLNQIKERLKKHPDIHFLDLGSEILERKKNSTYPLYYKADTHWNSLGAFWGSYAIVEKFNGMNIILPKLKLSDFSITVSKKETGDLVTPMGLKSYPHDLEIELVRVQQSTNNLPTRILLLGDSFGVALEPFLKNFFPNFYFERRSHANGFIKRFKPDIVVLEIAERYAGHDLQSLVLE